jgi:hypothetical protein
MAVTLRGGLGNQLFQWALCRELKANGVHAVLDPSCIPDGNFTLRGLCPPPSPRHSYQRYARAGARLGIARLPGAWTVRREAGFAFDRRVLDTPTDRTVLHGYWQTPRYWPTVQETLTAEVLGWTTAFWTEQGRLVADAIADQGAGILHVRRGDYTAPAARALHGLLEAEYFQTERDIARRAGITRFFVFSNDLDWCRDQLGAPDTSFVEPGAATSPAGEVALMAQGSYHILSNSSFSWWGAWLAQGRGPVVVPGLWFLDRSMDTSDLLPTTWRRSAFVPR